MIQTGGLECGVVALGSILAYYGRWVLIDELRAVCDISRDGSTATSLLNAARGYGLAASALKAEPRQLREVSVPCILHWRFCHYVIFEGMLPDGLASINDPARGRRRISALELEESMTGVVLTFSPMADFRREGEKPSVYHALLLRLKGKARELAFMLCVALLSIVPGLAIPYTVKLALDRIVLGGDGRLAIPLIASMTGMLALLCLLTGLQKWFLVRFESALTMSSSRRFVWHLLHLPISFFNQRFVGDVSSRVTLNDRVARLLSTDIAASVVSMLMVLIFACVMLQYDVALTGYSVLIAVLNLVTLRWVSRRRADSNMRLMVEQEKLNSTAMWGLQIIEDLKATSSEGDMFALWAAQQAKVLNLRQEIELANQSLEMMPILLVTLNTALILCFGGFRVIDGSLSVGDLVAFQMLAAAFIAPVNHIVSMGQRLQMAEGEIALLDDVLRAAPQSADTPETGRDITKLTGRLAIKALSFGYSTKGRAVLHNIELRVDPGRWVAIVGATGSGKSTLASLIAGLYAPWSGEILFDGVPRSSLASEVWKASVGVVSQGAMIFEGTVKENLTMWDPKISDEDIHCAARDACMLDEIVARPGQFEARVSEEGANWSGGQLQRLEIARILARWPTLVILDEATSNLDSDTEARIMANLRRRNCASLLIAHRLSTIREADEIIVLQNGVIAERGNHAHLMEMCGIYHGLLMKE
jgi:NHLM bacteriocin system ABC transporter peptidase/ATP-binding protein